MGCIHTGLQSIKKNPCYKIFGPRKDHTADGNLVCGGYPIGGTCYNVLTGDTINLINNRFAHTSWMTDAGTYLIGGWDGSSYRTTELIYGLSTQEGFALKYST